MNNDNPITIRESPIIVGILGICLYFMTAMIVMPTMPNPCPSSINYSYWNKFHYMRHKKKTNAQS